MTSPTNDPDEAFITAGLDAGEDFNRLLAAFATPGEALYWHVMDEVLAKPHLIHVVNLLVGFCHRAIVDHVHDGDERAALRAILEQLNTAREITGLTPADFEREDYRRCDGEPLP